MGVAPGVLIASIITKEGTAEYDEETIAAATSAAAAAIDDSSLRLPFYLLRVVGRNDRGVNLNNVFEKGAALGDGGDSDVEGDDAHDHDVALTASILKRMSLLEETDTVEDTDDNCVVLARGGISTANMAVADTVMVNIPDTPTDWVPPTQKAEQGEPNFVDVDNPGEWSQFVFRPEFGTTAPKQYKRHCMPTGAQPVPKIQRASAPSRIGNVFTRGGRMKKTAQDERAQQVRTCSQSPGRVHLMAPFWRRWV